MKWFRRNKKDPELDLNFDDIENTNNKHIQQLEKINVSPFYYFSITVFLYQMKFLLIIFTLFSIIKKNKIKDIEDQTKETIEEAQKYSEETNDLKKTTFTNHKIMMISLFIVGLLGLGLLIYILKDLIAPEE